MIDRLHLAFPPIIEMTTSATTSPARGNRAVVLTVAGAFFLLLLDASILNTSLPRVADSMGVKPLALSPTITAYLLASVATMPLSGWLSAKFGGRRVYFIAIALFTLASAACGLAGNLWQLIVARILQGAAGGTMLTVGRAIALRDAPKSELMSISSLLVWPALMAPVIGPPLGGWITTYASWRWNFLLNVPLGLLALALIMRFVPKDEASRDTPLDWRGALLTVGGLAALFGGLELTAQIPEHGGDWRAAAALIALGIALLLVAARHLLHSAHPVISLAPLRVKTFALSTFTAGTYSTMCLHATPYLLPLMFQLAFGASPAEAGAMLLPYFLGNLLIKSLTTPALRRFGFKAVLIVDGVLAMGFIALCGLVTAGTPWLVSAAILFAAGAARSMLFTALNTLCFADIEPAERNAASTLSSVSALLGQSLGIVVATLTLALVKAAGDRTALVAADFRIAFFVVAAIGLLTVLMYATLSAHAGEEVSGRVRAQQRDTSH